MVEELNKVDILFVGAGPASLAGAIKLKQLLNEKGRKESVVVIEKADKLGQHNLSGAVFEAHVLDELLPGWRERKDAFVTKTHGNEVKADETVFLFGQDSFIRLPEGVVPKYLRHKGDYTLSISEMVNWLAGIARELGVEIYTGFAARELIIHDGVVKGVKLGDKGLDKEGHKQSNYIPGDIIQAKVTVLGEGSLGQLAEDMVQKLKLDKGKNHQIHSVGVKEILRLPAEGNKFGNNRVIHTMGYPSRANVFGGGTLYSMGENLVAVAVILALDWPYADLNPQKELQLFKSHAFVKKLIEGGEAIAYGAKTLPEGGYYSLPRPYMGGGIIIGDDAGFTSARKLKGLHYAIKSGMLAAEAIAKAVEAQDFSEKSLKAYEGLLNSSFIVEDLKAGRNYRQLFSKTGPFGLYAAAPLSLVQQFFPVRLGTGPDYKTMRRQKLGRKDVGGIDRLTDVSLSGTVHREDEPSHITITDPAQCASCAELYGTHPCEHFCPGEVYRFEEDNLILSPSNCLHCQTCRIKCPRQVIKWVVPEGGDGPKYKVM